MSNEEKRSRKLTFHLRCTRNQDGDLNDRLPTKRVNKLQSMSPTSIKVTGLCKILQADDHEDNSMRYAS